MGGLLGFLLVGFMLFGFLTLYRAGTNLFSRARYPQDNVAPRPVRETPRTPTRRDTPAATDIATFIRALENEGYFGLTKLKDEDMTYIDHPVLCRMIDELAKHHKLEWVLPEYRLRVRTTPDCAPDAFRAKYQWVIMTPTHAIGCNPPIN